MGASSRVCGFFGALGVGGGGGSGILIVLKGWCEGEEGGKGGKEGDRTLFRLRSTSPGSNDN